MDDPEYSGQGGGGDAGQTLGEALEAFKRSRAGCRKSTRRVVELYALLFCEKGRLPEADFVLLGRIYRPDQERPEWAVKRLLKEPKIKELVRAEMARLVSIGGITPERVIEGYEQFRRRAMRSGKLRVAKSVLDRYAEMLDMKPDPMPHQACPSPVDLDALLRRLE